jgi:hypothetical protein
MTQVLAPSERDMERPEPRVRLYWQLAHLTQLLVLGLVVGPILWAIWLAFPAEAVRLALGFGGGAVLVLLVALALIAPIVRYRTFRFFVAPRRLWARDGVFILKEKVIPASRLQHVDVAAGPIERMVGLSSLSVFTAGGSAATFRIAGLRRERAEELRSLVLEAAESERARISDVLPADATGERREGEPQPPVPVVETLDVD